MAHPDIRPGQCPNHGCYIDPALPGEPFGRCNLCGEYMPDEDEERGWDTSQVIVLSPKREG